MSAAAAVVDFEITGEFSESALPSSPSAVVLFRLHGRPLGWGAAPVTDGHLDRATLIRQFIHEHAWTCALPLAERAIQGGRPLMPEATALLQSPPPALSTGPLVTVAVRSRTPANRLEPCLDSLLRLDYLPLDRVLIDASDDQRHVEALVRERYPQIRYSRAPGWGMASCQAVEECRGDILAVTDGESVVDRQWVSALVHVFLADPEVMTVSGLAVPHSLRRPFRRVLPAGTRFCRSWQVREGDEASDGAIQRALERASSNIAHWCPLRPTPSRYTRVWEPAAIVRTLAPLPRSRPASTRGAVRTLDRNVDLRDGVVPISDACDYDSLRLHVTWSGEPVGIVRFAHNGAVVSRLWIQDAIAQQLTAPILDAGLHLGPDVSRALLTADLVRYMVSRWKPATRRPSPPATVRTAAA
jgi:Glycosyl transferase family 2